MSAKRFELFEFAILLHPTEKAWKEGERTVLTAPIQELLAPDLETARLTAATKIPEGFHGYMDRVEVAVRPFCETR